MGTQNTGPKAQPGGPAQSATSPAAGVPRWLQGVAQAEVRRPDEYIKPGEYTMTVQAVRQFTSRKHVPFLVVELQVDRVNFQVLDTQTGAPRNNRQGHTVSWMVNFTTDGAQRDIVSFLHAVCTAEELDNLTDNWVNQAAAPEGDGRGSVLVGRKVYCQAEDITTSKGTQFTRVRWSTFSPDITQG